MGLLDGSRIQRIMGRAFRPIFGAGEFIRAGKVRQINGTLRTEILQRIDVKIQFDVCTEAMRKAEGYTATDTRVIILRDDLELSQEQFNSDCYLIGRGVEWSLNEVTTDPGESYFEARASLRKPGTVPAVPPPEPTP